MRICNKCNAFNIDGDKFCRSCGNQLESEKIVICKKCGSNNDSKSRFCSSCGYSLLPQSSAPQKQKVTVKQKSKKSVETIITETVVGLLLLAGLIYGLFFLYNKYKVYSYESDLHEITNLMINSGNEGQDISSEFYSVWYNCVNNVDDESTNEYTKNQNGDFYSDCNDALTIYTSTQQYQDTIKDIAQKRQTVEAMYKTLKKPPEEYKDAYAHLIVVYDAYEDYMDLVMYPQGSIQEYILEYNMNVKLFTKYIEELKRFE